MTEDSEVIKKEEPKKTGKWVNTATNIIGLLVLLVGLWLIIKHPENHDWQEYIWCTLAAGILLYVKNNAMADLIKDFFEKFSKK